MAQHEDRVGAGRHVVARGDQASQPRPDAEHLEVVPGDDQAAREIGVPAPGEAHLDAAERRQALEDALVVPQVDVLRVGQDAAAVEAHVNDARRIAHRQPLQQHRVHEAEDRRVGADAQGQREHGGRRESRALAERAPGEAQVVPEPLEGTPASRLSKDERRRTRHALEPPQVALQRARLVELREGRLLGGRRLDSSLDEIAVAVVEVLRQLVHDLLGARGLDRRPGQPPADLRLPVGPLGLGPLRLTQGPAPRCAALPRRRPRSCACGFRARCGPGR